MRNIIKLFLLTILTGCSPVNQIGLVTNQNPNTIQKNNEVLPPGTNKDSSIVEKDVNSDKLPEKNGNLTSKDSKVEVSENTNGVVENNNNQSSNNSNIHAPILVIGVPSGNAIDNTDVIYKGEINPNLRDADIRMLFKDEYKVRLKRMSKELTQEEKNNIIEYDEKYNKAVEDFISLADANPEDLKNLNDTIRKYNVISLTGVGIGESEEYYENLYQESKKTFKRAGNFRSTTLASLKDTDVKALVEELRNNKLVKAVDLNLKPVDQ